MTIRKSIPVYNCYSFDNESRAYKMHFIFVYHIRNYNQNGKLWHYYGAWTYPGEVSKPHNFNYIDSGDDGLFVVTNSEHLLNMPCIYQSCRDVIDLINALYNHDEQ